MTMMMYRNREPEFSTWRVVKPELFSLVIVLITSLEATAAASTMRNGKGLNATTMLIVI